MSSTANPEEPTVDPGASVEQLDLLDARRTTSMFEASGDGVLVVTTDDRIVRYANRTARRMFGLTIVGTDFGTPVDGSEVDLVGSDGRIAEMRVTEISHGGRAAWLVMLRDVSKRALELREARKDRDSALDQAERRTILLREVDHRVLNTFQMLSSLVQLRRRAVADPALGTELDRIRSRITAVGRSLHALNRTGSNETIRLDRFLSDILSDLVGLDANVDIRLDLSAAEIIAGRAQYIGLIMHELVRNAIKYAYPGDRTGGVRVTSRTEANGDLHIEVVDEGIGIDPIADAKGSGMGAELNRTLARMLGGDLTVHTSGAGTRCVLTVPQT